MSSSQAARCTRIFFLTLAAMYTFTPGAFAQMQFSVYQDVAMDDGGTIIYGYSTSYDESWGCGHWGYLSSTRLVSPIGREALTQVSGLQSNTALALNNEYGEYTIATRGYYNCSCIGGGTAMWGFSERCGAARLAYILDYIQTAWTARYVRCNPGTTCYAMDVLKEKMPPPQNLWVRDQ